MRLSLSILAMASVLIAMPTQQQAPATEVYLASVSNLGLSSLVNISNSPGYDNQPSFLPDSSAMLFASDRGGKQTDIYRYDIATSNLTQLTKTPESEYSPAVTPDGKSFSVIRVEADKTQRLWQFDLDGSNPRVMLENVKPVGYHAWIDATHLALFVLGEPATLQIADTSTGKAEIVAKGIGRSVLVRPRTGTVTFTTTDAKTRVVNEFNPKTQATRQLTAALEGSEYAAWTASGRLLMASGSVISMMDSSGERWMPLFDLSSPPEGAPLVTNITRLAASPDGKWIALVAEPRR